MGLKSQKFSCSFLALHLYARQLACEPQTGSLASQLLSKNNQFSRSKVYLQKHAGCCFFCGYVYARQKVLKIHGNLNKGTPGSMKLNQGHATISRETRKQYIGYNSLECVRVC